MSCTVWCPLHGIGRAIARWNRLVIKKFVRGRFLFARAARPQCAELCFGYYIKYQKRTVLSLGPIK